MMRIVLALSLLAFMLSAQASDFWSKLWFNADQRGEALLKQGDASNAAKEYADPRRKAYAKLKAGDYQGAIHDLENLHDSEADYNRGNALAHVGDLHRALEAYDAALKSDPDNQDARHNRELVAKALEQQPPQQQNADGKKSEDGKKEGKQDKQGDQNSQEGKSSQSDNKPSMGKDSSAQNKPEQSDKEGGKSQDDNNQNDQALNGKPQESKQTSGQQAQSTEKSAAQSGQAAGQQIRAKDDAEQARRDAEASFVKPTADGKNGTGMGDEANTTTAKPATARKTEQQIVQEQWLRSIPDDPGGLLQRKFMIKHLMRQREAQQ